MNFFEAGAELVGKISSAIGIVDVDQAVSKLQFYLFCVDSLLDCKLDSIYTDYKSKKLPANKREELLNMCNFFFPHNLMKSNALVDVNYIENSIPGQFVELNDIRVRFNVQLYQFENEISSKINRVLVVSKDWINDNFSVPYNIVKDSLKEEDDDDGNDNEPNAFNEEKPTSTQDEKSPSCCCSDDDDDCCCCCCRL